ncbi:MAG: hypothetical protein ACR2O8_09260 [Rhizobiaceae bacterium]
MLTNFPLMALALISYNGLIFGLGGDPELWQAEIFTLPMMSGALWLYNLGDLMITVGLVLLFIEILKATRIGKMSILDHLLSILVLMIFLVEFLMVPAASTSVFFGLMMMTLIDVMAGLSVSIRSATRDVSLGDSI